MANILDYLDWRGDLTLAQDPFNEVDNLILAELSFVDFGGIVPGPGEGRAIQEPIQSPSGRMWPPMPTVFTFSSISEMFFIFSTYSSVSIPLITSLIFFDIFTPYSIDSSRTKRISGVLRRFSLLANSLRT